MELIGFEEGYISLNDEGCKFKNDNFGYWTALKCFPAPFETGNWFTAALQIKRRCTPGGTRIWILRECAADSVKPIPTFRGHFGKNRTHL